MQLQIASYFVTYLTFTEKSQFANGTVAIKRQDLLDVVKDDPAIAQMDMSITHPGENVRIVHLLDAIEPRCKTKGHGQIFPGLLGAPETVGAGRTQRLAGMAILTTAQFPEAVGGLLQTREAIVDMNGAVARYSPFSTSANLVLTCRPSPNVSNAEFDAAIRRASLRIAEYLASLTLELAPDRLDTIEPTPADDVQPRIVYLYQAQSQGTFADTYLYGKPIDNLVPTLIHPNEIMDGALVSGNYVYACFKNPTFLHQNNPVIQQLYAEHGKSLNFAGVVLYRGHNYTHAEKQRAGNYAAKLAQLLRADGVILTGEGGGNSAIDMMLALQECERLGIKTTVITYELGGPDGKDFPLVDAVPELNAIVSTGSCDKMITLPPMPTVIGGERYLDTGAPATEEREIVLDKIYCSTNQLGAGYLMAQAY